jgi:prepilin-type N-terminal cleavage/methylation domain-containing protein
VFVCLARRVRNIEGFTLVELMLVVGIITVIAAIAVPGLMRARLSANHASAVGSMRTISGAQASFSSSCGGGGYAVDLADLGLAPLAGGNAFVPQDIVDAFPGGIPKSGYEFVVASVAGDVVLTAAETCNGSTNDTETEFFATADPIAPSSGTRFFGTDQSGQIRQGDATIMDITDGIPLQ